MELVRLEGYSMFRGLSLNAESLNKFSTYLTAALTDSVPLEERDWAVGKNVGDLKLQETTGARLIAVVRLGEVHANPDPQFDLKVGDLLVLFGRHAMLDKAVIRVRHADLKEDSSREDEPGGS